MQQQQMAEVNGNYRGQTVIEKHYVIVGEPNGFYLSHVMPEDGTGYKIATSVYSAKIQLWNKN